MNKVLLFFIVVGFAVAGWVNRDRISGWIAEKRGASVPSDESDETQPPAPSGSAPAKSSATPNPAVDSIALAKRTYPALAKAGSPFNAQFVAFYNETKATDPGLLVRADWPIQLADRTAKKLGGAPMPRASSGVVGWTENYAQAVESAKMDNKKLLLDFTGSDWCGYCMALEKEVFSTSQFQTWARDNVVLVRIDFPQSHPQSGAVKQQNAGLKAKYPVNGYPTIVVADTSGNVLGHRSGYDPGSGPDRFIAWLDTQIRH